MYQQPMAMAERPYDPSMVWSPQHTAAVEDKFTEMDSWSERVSAIRQAIRDEDWKVLNGIVDSRPRRLGMSDQLQVQAMILIGRLRALVTRRRAASSGDREFWNARIEALSKVRLTS